MIRIYTATFSNTALARLWNTAIKGTLPDARTTIYYANEAPQ